MSINTGELRRQLRKLTIHPDQHDQGLWAKAITEDNTAPRQSACDTSDLAPGSTPRAVPLGRRGRDQEGRRGEGREGGRGQAHAGVLEPPSGPEA